MIMSTVIDPLSIVKLTTRPVHVDHRIDLNRYFAHTADGREVELPLGAWRALFKAILANPLRRLVRTRVGLELVAEGDELLVRWLDGEITNEEKRPRPATVEAAVAEMAAMGKESKPELAGRMDSAAELVLLGRVTLADGGKAQVGPYRVAAGRCTCADYKYRGDWCKHRLAARMARHLAANGFELPRPATTTTPQISAENLTLIARGQVIDNALRERAAYAQSSHGARDRALRMLGNGAKTLPADLARRAGVGGRESGRYEIRNTSEEEAR
jgi:hypothetical protein